ncbi:MAG: DUF2069 domain-containing protein [Halieaceae bacterium]|nr:DUF2069 domain-containing protein [Halieaceae bacterium]
MTERSLRTASTRWLALAGLALFVVALAAAITRRDAPIGIYLLCFVPLAIFLPGLIRDRVRTYVWLCFVILWYFITVVLWLFNEPSDPVLAWAAMFGIVVFFNAAMMYVRWRSQELRAQAEISEVERP